MKAVSNRYDTSSELARLINRESHCLRASQLAKSMTGVEDNGTLPFGYDSSRFVSGHGSFPQPIDIHIDEHDTVRR